MPDFLCWPSNGNPLRARCVHEETPDNAALKLFHDLGDTKFARRILVRDEGGHLTAWLVDGRATARGGIFSVTEVPLTQEEVLRHG